MSEIAVLMTPAAKVARLRVLEGEIDSRRDQINDTVETESAAIISILREVMKDRLWEVEYTSPEAWFAKRYPEKNKSNARMRQLVKVASLTTVSCERHGRELLDVSPEMAALIMEEVGPKPTAPKIKEVKEKYVVKRMREKETSNAAARERAKVKEERAAAKKRVGKDCVKHAQIILKKFRRSWAWIIEPEHVEEAAEELLNRLRGVEYKAIERQRQPAAQRKAA